MKKLKIIFYSVIFLFCSQTINSQTINWKTIDSTKHILNVNFGQDYSLSNAIGYGYKIITKLPVILNAIFSMPLGETVFDDFKTKIGGQILLLNKSNFKSTIGINGIYRKHETHFVRLQNFGSEIEGTFGYYISKWFIATEIGFDKAIVTHFKHSKAFKEEIYAEVVDDWYEPATGDNFYYGLVTGVSFRKHEIYLNIGKVITKDFRTSPFIPFYAQLGYNCKFRKKRK